MHEYLLHIDTAIITPRTVVRRFRENDGAELYEMVQKNRFYLEDYFPVTVKETDTAVNAEFYVRKKIAAWYSHEEYSFGIFDKEGANLIGLIKLLHIDWNVPKAEVAYFLDEELSGKGIMSEVLLNLLNFAFEELRMERLYIKVAMDNHASQRLARKCGFTREGDLRDDYKKPGGEIIDMMLLGLTRVMYDKI